MTQDEAGDVLGVTSRQICRWEGGKGPIRPPVFVALEALLAERSARPTGEFTFIDLFAGIGGFHRGFHAAGGACVFTSEWDSWAQETYRENFPGYPIHGDIRTIAPQDVPDHDVLLAGFPCQPFSIAGVSKKNALGRKHGFECDTQGTLFFNIEKIIEAKQPKAFVLENVKNLVSHDRGSTFRVIEHTLREKLGYRIRHRIIDARHWVPQHRERIFIVGLHPDLDARFDFNDMKIPRKGPSLGAILHPQRGKGPVEDRFTDARGRALEKYVLSDHLWEYLQHYALKHKAKGNGFGFGLVGEKDVARTLSARYYKDGSEILVRRPRGNPRRLTPRECARLMGFDDKEHGLFRIPVSDTQAYKQFGNSVAVPVVKALATALLPYLRGERTGMRLEEELEFELT
jgi:DNA (cytosine-5)-methyltransferase 1